MSFLPAAVFGVLSLCWHAANAQASSPAPSEQKRSETTTSSSPVALARAAPTPSAAAASSVKTVAERKAETIDAAKKGLLVPAGHGSPAQAQ